MPRISTTLTFIDRLGAWKVRWGVGRMHYMVPPGLYAIGNPNPDSPVLVTANYKMSYDIVRSVLEGRNCWVLVLETYGINVWCAAGKGTFGTEELIRRIRISELAEVVNHRQLVLPILGAAGVAAHKVTKQTSFNIRYAAIRAEDIPEYLDNGMTTTPLMREITFTTWERAVLIPVELAEALKPTVIAAAVIFVVLAALHGRNTGLIAVYGYLGAVMAGIVVTPLFLPWLPGRSFAFKGVLTGLVWSMVFCVFAGGIGWSPFMAIAAFLTLPTISAFYALNFTGCTPFTSRSGVKKEMRIALPAIACTLLVGVLVALLDIIL
ncbi:MAG: acetyl-CoA synthase subunit gamma [Deltaproteobacteria bacterium]|nr:acetyl-CoA synthase subunit gamma [Deltaproteobacteria bacterium]